MIDPQIRFPDERTGAHAIGRSLEQLFTLMHDDDVVRQAHDQIDVVLDQKDGDAARQRFDQCVEFSRFGGRHPLRGLVEHQQPGFKRHADGNLDPALVAMGEISSELVRALLQAELLENGPSARLRPGQAIQSDEITVAPFQTLAGETDVLECAQSKKQIRDLKGSRDAESLQRKRRLSRDVSRVQLDRSGIRPHVPAIRLKAVLLPAPFGPIMDVTRWGAASKLRFLTARSPPNALLSALTLIMARPSRALPAGAEQARSNRRAGT